MGQSLSASLGGDNAGEMPEFVKWYQFPTKGEYGDDPIFFTDGQIKTVREFGRSDRNVAWILEPHGLRPDPYLDALELEEYFGAILTFDMRYIHREKWWFYPYGGSWIHPHDWGLKEKSRLVSILGSQKNTTEGHKLRHAVRECYPDQIEDFGFDIYVPKLQALASFMYSIVIENSRQADYFSEKLIDCICLGTVPIYWGSPQIDTHFDMQGIITFQDIDELDEILLGLSIQDYAERLPAVGRNIETAKEYRCVEDQIFRMYPELFGAS
jgi:hypothetical protein